MFNYGEMEELIDQLLYHSGPKFSDKQAYPNSADPDQTAPQGLHCLLFHLHLFYEIP